MQPVRSSSATLWQFGLKGVDGAGERHPSVRPSKAGPRWLLDATCRGTTDCMRTLDKLHLGPLATVGNRVEDGSGWKQ